MNRFERWILKTIIGAHAWQIDHRNRLIKVHQLIRDVVEEQYPEDNRPTVNAYLNEVSREAYK
jgi:hypothetical protein